MTGSTIPGAPLLRAFTLSDCISSNARSRPTTLALICGDETVDWRTLDRGVSRVAHAIRRFGIRPGERVAFLSGNSIWIYHVLYGIMRSRAVVNGLNPMLHPRAMATMLEDSDSKVLFVGAGHEQVAREVMDSLGPDRQVSMIFEADERPGGQPSGGQPFGEFINGAGEELPADLPSHDDICNVIYSSGTTGTPKGIVHSHLARLWFAAQCAIGQNVVTGSKSVIAISPYSNGMCLIKYATVLVGGTSILMPSFSVEAFFEIVRKHRPTNVFLVPTLFQAIVEHPDVESIDFSCFECLLTGGAPMPAALKARVLELMGPRLFELWGFTESVVTFITPQEMVGRMSSVGRPMVGCEVRLIDEAGREVKPPGTGEIVGRSLSLMEGYLNRPQVNDEILWRDEAGVSYIRTGDIGELDEDGYLYIRGRKKDMIISGGINVYPVDLEAVLLEHPEVKDATVVGVTHEKWGETPVGFVVEREGAGVDGEEVRAWANGQLGKFQRLSGVVVRSDDFPRNAMGKVMKNELLLDLRTGQPR